MSDTRNLIAREAARWHALAFDAANHAAELEALKTAPKPLEAPDGNPLPKLALIVGHQRTSPGAMGVDPIKAPEYEWCGDLAGRIADAARIQSLHPRIFRRDEGGIRGAYARVRAWIDGYPAVAIEVHFNAFNGLATGTETLVVTDAPGEYAFAQAVQAAMVSVLGLTDRRVKRPHPDRGAVALNQLDVPHVLIEPMFGDNHHDARIAHTRRDGLAAAIADACATFLKGH